MTVGDVGARSSTTCEREWERRRASGSSDRASVYPRRVPRSSGQRLLSHDRRLGVRFVAGADEAGRGSLAGPLVVAGVLLDYELLRGVRVRPLAALNDSKQVSAEERETLFHAVVCSASQISVRVVSAFEIDRAGLHRSNLRALRAVLADLHPPAGRPSRRRFSTRAEVHLPIARSSTATREAPRSQPPRSWRRWFATA